MLELLGSGYVINHVVAEFRARTQQYVYRIYVTDLLKCLAESWGADVPYRYRDVIEPEEDEPESGDEVALRVIRRLGLKVKTNGFYETESEPVA